MDTMDSRFRGNDKLSYIVVNERLAISLHSKTVSLNNLTLDCAQNTVFHSHLSFPVKQESTKIIVI